MIPPWPPPLSEVVREGPIWVSDFASILECPLRVLATRSESEPDLLPSRPEAKLGAVLHELIADGTSAAPMQLSDFKARVTDLLARDEHRLDSIAACQVRVGIRDVVAPAEFTNRLGMAWRTIRESYSAGRPVHTGQRAGGRGEVTMRDRRSLREPGTYLEYPLHSTDRTLSGRPDRIDVDRADSVRIVEYKTGRALDGDGEPLERHRTQLEAYGWLVRSHVGGDPDIELVLIGQNGEWSSLYSDSAHARMADLVREAASLTPADERLSAADLARPGSACLGCRARSRCTAYLEWAPQQWVEEDNSGLPLDTWGEVETISVADNGFGTIHIRNSAGQLDCIHAVPRRLMATGLGAGERIAFFELLRAELRRGGSRPRNFRIAGERRHDGAHSAAAYSGN